MKFYLKKSVAESHLIMGKLYDAQFSDGRFVYSTGERIRPSQWSSGKPKKGHEDLSERLLEISKQAVSYIRLNRSHLSKEGLKKHLDSLRPKEIAPVKSVILEELPKTIIQLWSEWLDSLAGTVEPRSYQSYRSSLQTSVADAKKKKKRANFNNFLSDKKWLDILPANFTITHYNLYVGYLRANSKPNTTAKRLKHFKAAMQHIQDDLKIPIGFDLNKIKYRETAGLKLSLTEDELQAYIDANTLPSHLVKVRDLAVIQCATGLRLSDRGRIDKNLRGSKIKIEAKKTRGDIEIPITPAVRQILEKYNYELPTISEQNYRSGIKAIHKKLFPNQVIQVREGSDFRTVPVHEEISSHDMVRTFVTLSAERGMPIPSIAKITGKSIATLLKSYLVESQKVADKEMEKAWGSSPLKIAK
jgi:hypothetical protein